MNRPINWFEIPVADLDRAAKFYETLFGIQLQRGDMGPVQMAVFPYDSKQETGGSLIKGDGIAPSPTGPILYLNAESSFDAVLGRVEPAGGKVLMQNREMPYGPIAQFTDSEGNRLGLHAAR
jgi:hypothetical protein